MKIWAETLSREDVLARVKKTEKEISIKGRLITMIIIEPGKEIDIEFCGRLRKLFHWAALADKERFAIFKYVNGNTIEKIVLLIANDREGPEDDSTVKFQGFN
jgi:hypothetical protein